MASVVFFLAALACHAAPPVQVQPVRSTPGLVLATDGRTAPCDVLLFTPDGTQLFACGDDKVVRRWLVGDRAFSQRKPPLRWPIFREQRGSLFAMAFSPSADKVVIGGIGTRTGSVLVLDRDTGEVKHSNSPIPSTHATWAVAFAPSGKHVVYGTDVGEVIVWDLEAKKTHLLPGTGGKKVNRVRRVAFLSDRPDETRFVSVAQDGKILLGDVRPDVGPKTLSIAFEVPRLYQVAIDPARRWLAAVTGEGGIRGKEKDQARVEMIDLRAALEGKEVRKSLAIPRSEESYRYPHCLAFDHEGARLAVGCRVHPRESTLLFYRETGGLVFVFDLKKDQPLPAVLDVGYRPDAVAFRPTPKNSPAAWKTQLATAGGNNHEVRLWDVSDKGKVLDAIEGPGGCLWGVALSEPDRNGKVRHLAWKEKRADSPAHPNRWGGGEWRVFDLGKKTILTKKPHDFAPVAPIDEVKTGEGKEAWRVASTIDPYVWRILGPDKTDVPLEEATGLYHPGSNDLPRCYTFLPYTDRTGKAPVHVAVGHNYGVSLYECRPGEVKLLRVMVGHEGEVMAIAPSRDGKTLVTASRDQTLAGWSVVPWPTQRELGARFAKHKGRLVVEEVSPGSPAWEAHDPLTGGEDDRCRLAAGDVIDLLLFTSRDQRQAVYDPAGKIDAYAERYRLRLSDPKKLTLEQTLDRLQDVRPSEELIFVKRVEGREHLKLTTSRQRPLWRFFPERQRSTGGGRDWIVWRWRDYYYDTNSARADQYVGWQVNRGEREPEFFPLERFRGRDGGGFHQPAKAWAAFGQGSDPDKVIFPDVQPPDVKLQVVTPPTKVKDLVLKLSIRPRDRLPGQKLTPLVNLWVNDWKYPHEWKADEDGTVRKEEFVLPRDQLQNGKNVVRLQATNVVGGRGEASVVVEYAGETGQRTLYALCVGINDYSRVKGYVFGDLRCSRDDAEEVTRVLEQHKDSKLYRKAVVKLIPEQKATAAEIVTQLKQLGKQAKPGDWFVVFLSGHGYAEMQTGEVCKPGSFFFLCADTDRKKAETHLSSQTLHDALATIRCAKLVILDCCHSGDVRNYNPARDLSRESVAPLILSSCKGDQFALEPRTGKHGFFTQSLLDVLGDSAAAQNRRRDRPLRTKDVGAAILKRLPELLAKYKVDPNEQVPEFYPVELPAEAVLCGP